MRRTYTLNPHPGKILRSVVDLGECRSEYAEPPCVHDPYVSGRGRGIRNSFRTHRICNDGYRCRCACVKRAAAGISGSLGGTEICRRTTLTTPSRQAIRQHRLRMMQLLQQASRTAGQWNARPVIHLHRMHIPLRPTTRRRESVGGHSRPVSLATPRAGRKDPLVGRRGLQKKFSQTISRTS